MLWRIFMTISITMTVGIMVLFLSVATKFHPAEAALIVLLFASVLWGEVSTWFWTSHFSKLPGYSSTDILLGPRPEDPEAAAAWYWGRQFRYSMFVTTGLMFLLAVLIRMREG